MEQGKYATCKNNKVKKQQKAIKELVKANVAVETAAKKMRGRPRKSTTPSIAVVQAPVPAAKKRHPRLTAEEKALKEQNKASKKIERQQKKANKAQ